MSENKEETLERTFVGRRIFCKNIGRTDDRKYDKEIYRQTQFFAQANTKRKVSVLCDGVKPRDWVGNSSHEATFFYTRFMFNLKSRKFTFNDQTVFARLSGDYNPLHVDPTIARRLIYGQPVVHGIHALLWSLDVCLEGQTNPIELSTLKVSFLSPIFLDQEVYCHFTFKDNSKFEITLEAGGIKLIWIQVIFIPARHQRLNPSLSEYPEHRICRPLSMDEV